MADRVVKIAGERGRPAFRGVVGGVAGAVLCLLAGCSTAPHACDRPDVSAAVESRAGYPLAPPPPCDGQLLLPNGASLADGLNEEEAVLIALWNNALFQELLADLGVARGDLIQAGLLPNPEVVYFFHVPDKPFKYALELPLEALWLRPVRVRAAAGESARVCQRLTQSALDLIRDVRQAYADVLLAEARFRIAQEAVRLRGRIARVAATRLKEGDISPQEEATARIDATQARQDTARIRYDVSIASERLRNLLAIGADRSPLVLDPTPPILWDGLAVEPLTAEAVASRPDALAAEQNAAAAAERLRLARLGWVRLLGILDATSGRRTGHEFGPAFRVTLPIFNCNEGNIARAEAELERAVRQRATVRNQIIMEVHQAYDRYAQALAELEVVEKQVRPEVDAAIERTERAYREGNTPYVVVLETTRQLLDNRLRQEQLRADLRRASAELERAVGRHLHLPPPPPEAGPQIAPAKEGKP